MLKALLTCTLLGLALVPQSAIAAPIPPVPQYYLLDEANLLTSQQEKAIATLLIEHDHAAGQQIVVAIFKDSKGEDIGQYTRRVFDEWQIGEHGRGDGALLALFAKENKARFEAGYGLSLLDDARANSILRDILRPELNAGNPYRAIGLSVLDILRAVESPLIETGRAEQLLVEGGLHGSMKPVAHGFATGPLGWIGFLIIGLLFSAFVLNNILAAEAHFTGEGWFRPNPWKLLAPKALLDRRKAPRLNVGGTYGDW